MKLLITGANGFVGQHLVSRLSQRHEVYALVRAERQTQFANTIVMDLSCPLVRKALPGRMDVIVHLAQANVRFPEQADILFAVNTVATQHLLNYGREVGAKSFVLASSGDVYGHRQGLFKESDKAAPEDFYGLTKHTSELLVQSYADYLQPCVLRLFRPFGKGQVNRLIPRLAARLRRGEPVSIHNEDRPYMTPTYIDDVITAFERAIETSYAGVMNVAGDEIISMRELTHILSRVLEVTPRFEESGQQVADMMGDNAHMKEALGTWPFIKIEEGLRRIFSEQWKC